MDVYYDEDANQHSQHRSYIITWIFSRLRICYYGLIHNKTLRHFSPLILHIPHSLKN